MAAEYPTPTHLKHATKFGADADSLHGRWLVETLAQYLPPARRADPAGRITETDAEYAQRTSDAQYLLAPLEIAVSRLSVSSGRKRLPGRWYLAYLAFVYSRHVDVKPFWQHANSSIWRAAGFTERPTYWTTQHRFAELEHPAVIDAYEQVAARLVALAVKGSGGRVGQYLHVDSTEAETNAALEHICPRTSACWGKRGLAGLIKAKQEALAPAGAAGPDGEGEPVEADPSALAELLEHGGPVPQPLATTISGKGAVKITPTVESATIRAERHDSAAEPEPEDQEAEDTETGEAEIVERAPDRLIVKVKDCMYAVLDPTAGVRCYTGGKDGKVKRFWVGFYNAKAIDHYTGAPVAVRVTSASTQEFVTYPDLLNAAIANVGRQPLAVVGDRGYSVTRVFRHNTERDIASVFPWRAPNGYLTDRRSEEGDLIDRHGVPRCKQCGGPTRRVSFSKTSGSYGPKNGPKKFRGPRLYVQCVAPTQSGCHQRQGVRCELNWRMLVPLWRTDPVYLALRHSHDRYERVHNLWRVRWRVGAAEHSLRPKRRGRDCQQLRSNAALVCEWLSICFREGWLPGMRKPLDPQRIIVEDGTSLAEKLEQFRKQEGLHLPYGTAAVATGLGGPQPTPGSGTTAANTDISEPDDRVEPVIQPVDPPNGLPPKSAAEVDDDVPGFPW